jgi:hypothetical protein
MNNAFHLHLRAAISRGLRPLCRAATQQLHQIFPLALRQLRQLLILHEPSVALLHLLRARAARLPAQLPARQLFHRGSVLRVRVGRSANGVRDEGLE